VPCSSSQKSFVFFPVINSLISGFSSALGSSRHQYQFRTSIGWVDFSHLSDRELLRVADININSLLLPCPRFGAGYPLKLFSASFNTIISFSPFPL
jgi:hypothetical protein